MSGGKLDQSGKYYFGKYKPLTAGRSVDKNEQINIFCCYYREILSCGLFLNIAFC